MVLFWSDYATARAISMIPTTLCFFILLRSYRRHHFQHLLLLTIGMAFATVIFGLAVIAYLKLTPIYMFLHLLFYGLLLGIFIYTYEIMSYEKVSTIIMSSYTFALGGYLLSLFQRDAFDENLIMGENLRMWDLLMSGIFIIVLIRFYYHLLTEAPLSLKPISRFIFYGGLIILMIDLLISFIQDTNLKGILFIYIASIGISLLFISFAINPEVGFVLPFKVLRLTVLDTEAGIPIFTYTWEIGRVLADDDLFGGMVQGISLIMKESVGRGNVRDINLDNAVLILHPIKEFSLACVIVATHSSKALKNSLELFASRFVAVFHNKLENRVNVQLYANANVLIKECFPFLPD